MKELVGSLAVALAVLGALACATTAGKDGIPPPTVVPSVDLQRYAGTWYDVGCTTLHRAEDEQPPAA